MTNCVRKLRNTIKFKFIIAFIISIIIGNILSFLIVSPYINSKIEKVIYNRYEKIISDLRSSENYEEKLDDIINTYDDLGYALSINKDIEELNLTKLQKKELLEGNKSIYLVVRKPNAKVVGKIDDGYVTLELSHYSDIVYIIATLNKVVLFINIFICSIIISIVIRKLTRPIEKLADATNEISSGNFDIKIDIKSKDEVGMLIDKFNSMAKDLKNIEYMQTDFINNVSHEFKTPIAAIEGFATILKNTSISEEERIEYLNIIIDEASRLSELSSNILTLSKLDNIDNFKDNKKFSLDEQIRKTVILLEKEWSNKNISFNLNLSKMFYYGKEDYLMQVWINIINNAIKFSSENSEIDIDCYKNPEYAFVKIKDYGCGMDEDTIKRVFHKFYQGDSSRKSEGYGLGLSICKRIVDLSKGEIKIDSKLGEYTEILISLPY
ncbi:ATP-binding protein [Clostridium sp. LP20]|uniref:HAMP domain-containing sensor histidine kinase n=1 Tax=Clostridium sp. LP20 TaxID=3418665 RepID=UPI003EE782F2